MTLLLLLACSGTPKNDDSGAPADDSGAADDSGTTPVDLLCEDPEPPQCTDEMILELSFQDDASSDGTIEDAMDGDDHVTLFDATAGGPSRASDNPWLYVRFTRDGPEKVDIDDETSLEDMTWHLGMRRYNLRVNSGDGGPSCVMGAAVERKTYDEVTEVPDNVSWAEEDFYDDDCNLQTDMIGGPDSLLNGWWTYGSCVEATGTPYLLQLEDGSVVKLVVESYYEDDGSECGEGGWISIRWRFLD